MIKEDKILMKINYRNVSHFRNLGYEIENGVKEMYISVCDLFQGSNVKVTAVCEICSSENIINYSKYLVNFNRNGKNYYSCFKCKNIEKEKTCMEKYGVKSYSMTDEFRETESLKWKGIKKGGDKGEKTMLERYGVRSYFETQESKDYNRKWMSSDEFRNKSKDTLIEKYGVDSYSKTDEFKNRMAEQNEVSKEKSKSTFLERYGVEWYTQCEEYRNTCIEKKDETILKNKETCMERYGVDNVSKVPEVQQSMKNTKIERGFILPDHLLSEWEVYKRNVRKITNKFKKELYENWDGIDHYDGENIKGYFSHTHTHRFYPTIDHKNSVYYGFLNNIDPSEIGSIENLCITKRYINCTKSRMIEKEFLEKLKNQS